MRGASALQTFLEDAPGRPLRVMVVWEPVIPTDLAPPSSGTLERIHDPRVAQFWDPERRLSAEIVRSGVEPGLGPEDIVWDVVALFAAETRWGAQFPRPAFRGFPVVDSIPGLRRAVDALPPISPPPARPAPS